MEHVPDGTNLAAHSGLRAPLPVSSGIAAADGARTRSTLSVDSSPRPAGTGGLARRARCLTPRARRSPIRLEPTARPSIPRRCWTIWCQTLRRALRSVGSPASPAVCELRHAVASARQHASGSVGRTASNARARSRCAAGTLMPLWRATADTLLTPIAVSHSTREAGGNSAAARAASTIARCSAHATSSAERCTGKDTTRRPEARDSAKDRAKG